ncbi:MAG: glycosyltransferase [Lachnospiraceae bacterium]|nr:glycosyltransferase [Lachnospiraceae bacterium]
MIPISVCIITKNEAEHLDKCLSSLQPYNFEIVVVDTGSSDNSKEIALKFTDKVYDFEWVNDFSAARNFSISRASHNVILVLDTDEYITELDIEQVEQLIEANPKGIGCIKRLDYFEANNEMHHQISNIGRLFNRKYYHYVNPIHEDLYAISNVSPYLYNLPITADHVGYLGSEDKLYEKAMRNAKLILNEIEKDPENPYNYFQIAQSYLLLRDHETACEYFAKAIEHNPSPQDEYTRILVCNYGNTLIDFGKADEALSLLSFYEYYSDNADYLCMVGLIYLHLNQQLKALPEFVKALTAPTRDSIENKTISYYIGFIYELFKQKDIARQHYQRCGDYAPALEALKRIDGN